MFQCPAENLVTSSNNTMIFHVTMAKNLIGMVASIISILLKSFCASFNLCVCMCSSESLAGLKTNYPATSDATMKALGLHSRKYILWHPLNGFCYGFDPFTVVSGFGNLTVQRITKLTSCFSFSPHSLRLFNHS